MTLYVVGTNTLCLPRDIPTQDLCSSREARIALSYAPSTQLPNRLVRRCRSGVCRCIVVVSSMSVHTFTPLLLPSLPDPLSR